MLSERLWMFVRESPDDLCTIITRGKDSAYERGGDVRWEFWIKPLKETDLGGAQAFFDP